MTLLGVPVGAVVGLLVAAITYAGIAGVLFTEYQAELEDKQAQR